MRKEELLEKIRKKEAAIAVIGLGQVGLPTAAVFADAGFTVIGADIDPKKVKMISAGKSPIIEHDLDEIVEKTVRKGKLKATSNVLQAAGEADVIIVCVQTPLTKNRAPDLTFLKKACKTAAEGLSKGKLVIIESTVPPKTTENFAKSIFEKESGLKCGKEFWLAHCPERILPGKALRELIENSRVVGGYGQESSEIAAELYKATTKGEILIADSTTAETAKLAENTFRDVNIAFANELALICEQLGLDVMEVIKLANTHPRVDISRPGCGVGGPCLPKDPYLLLYPVKAKGFKSRIIEPARMLNDSMPVHIVKLVAEALRKENKEVKGSKIAVFGVAYKGNVGTSVNSPSEKIIRELKSLGAQMVVYDPYSEETFGAEKAKDVKEAVEKADCIIIATDHKAFLELDFRRVKALMNEKPVIVDGRRMLNPREMEQMGFVYRGI